MNKYLTVVFVAVVLLCAFAPTSAKADPLGTCIGICSFLYSGGGYSNIGAPFFSAYGINNNGEIVGGDPNFSQISVDNAGVFTMISVPGLQPFMGVNDAGQIVGSVHTGGTTIQAFVYNAGTFDRFSVPSASETFAYGIDNSGDIVGTYYNGTNHGFVDIGGVITSVDVPGAVATSAQGINNAGDIVGTYCATYTNC